MSDTAPAPSIKRSSHSLSTASSMGSLSVSRSPSLQPPMLGTPKSTKGASRNRSEIVRMDFGAAPLGTTSTRVVLALSNPSPLPVCWRFSFRSELEAYYSQKRDAWMTMSMMDDEVSDNMKRQKWMVENKIFKIKPKSGSLSPGTTTSVEISYSHTATTDPLSSNGYDELPVYFEITNGRSAVVQLRGRTLAPQERYLHFATLSHSFFTIPIGILDPPLQPYRLYNHGDVDVSFSFDLSALETMKSENYNFSVFECLTPSGYIPAGSQFTTYWRFTPLEVTDYECRVTLHTKSGPTTSILFCGTGHHPTGTEDFENQSKSCSLPPPQPHLEMENQHVTLSLELLNLETLPVHCVERRLVVLHNNSPHPATFSWVTQPLLLPPPLPPLLLPSPSLPPSITAQPIPTSSSVIDVSPSSGTLTPGEKRACCVVLRPGPHVGFFEIDIPCNISYSLPLPPSSAPRKSEPSEVLAQSSGSPPRSSMRARMSQQSEKGRKEERKRGEPMFPPITLPRQQPACSTPLQAFSQPSQDHPSPNRELPNGLSHTPSHITTTTLFLVLQARTLPTAQFRHLRGNNVALHTPSPSLLLSPPNPPPQRLTEELATSLRPLASSFLSSLVSEILADPDVQEEARHHDDDDFIPYFEQLRDESEEGEKRDDEDEKEKRKADGKPKIEHSNSFKISTSFRNLFSAPNPKSTKTSLLPPSSLPDPAKLQRFNTIEAVYKDSKFGELAEHLIEATIYNLMDEVLHGDFPLDEPPAVVLPSHKLD